MTEDLHIYELPNGIRVVHQYLKNAEVSHCGFTINVGSRDELPEENGMAHLIEHTIFKGTQKRKPFHILNRMDAVGGELNAYTSKEDTCFYASFQSRHYKRAIELLTDITFNSVFPEKEIEKEKDVITDEINSYLDSPSEQIYDDFEELIFNGHPLARNILGTRKLLKKFQRIDVLNFVQQHYKTNQLVFSSVGNISPNKLRKLLEKYISVIPESKKKVQREPFTHYQSREKEVKTDTFQAHCMIGSPAYPITSKKRRSMVLLNNLLGGPGMNSRLNLAIREKYGFTYNLDSSYLPYSDTGVFAIYLGTDPKYLNKSIRLIHSELKKLRTKKLGSIQLHNARQQLIGHIALARESKANVMTSYGKSLLFQDKIDPLHKVYRDIEAIQAEDLLEIANDLFQTDHLSQLIYLPKKQG